MFCLFLFQCRDRVVLCLAHHVTKKQADLPLSYHSLLRAQHLDTHGDELPPKVSAEIKSVSWRDVKLVRWDTGYFMGAVTIRILSNVASQLKKEIHRAPGSIWVPPGYRGIPDRTGQPKPVPDRCDRI